MRVSETSEALNSPSETETSEVSEISEVLKNEISETSEALTSPSKTETSEVLNSPSKTETSEVSEISEVLKNKVSETSEVLQETGRKVTLNIETGIIRERPSIYANVKSMIKKGDTVSIIAEKDDKWYQVQLNDGSTGWVHRRLFESSQIQKKDSPEKAASSQSLEPTVKAVNKIKDKKSGMVVRLIQDIKAEKSSDTEEKVIFTMNDGFTPSKTSFLNEGNDSKIVCDFSDTQLAEGVTSSVKVNGNLIKTIRIGLHEKSDPKLRVVMDMVSGKKYHLNHMLIKNENRYVLIFNAEK